MCTFVICIVCVWGNPVALLDRGVSGRPGYDYVIMERPNKSFFSVLIRRGEALKLKCDRNF